MNKKTKTILALVVVIIIIGIISYAWLRKQTEEVSTETRELVKIGAILPFTGKMAEWGEKTQKGIELALQEVNKKEKKLEVIYEDSAAEIAKAVSAAHKLIQIDKVQVLICQLSDICSALAPIAQENKTVLFGFTHTPAFTEPGSFVFNMRGEATYAGEALGEFASEKYQTVAVLCLNNLTQKGVYEGFQTVFEEQGRQVLFVDFHNKEELDFRTSLLKIKQKNPEALLFASRFKNTIEIVKQARELKLDQPVIASLGTDTQSFLDALGDLAEGIVFPTSIVSQDTENLELQNVLSNYQQEYNEVMPLWAAESYDAVRALGLVVEEGACKSEEIKNALLSLKEFQGLASNLNFNEYRTILKEYHMFTIRNGEFVPYED